MIVSNLKANLDVGKDSDHTLFTNSDLSIAMGDYSGDNMIFNGAINLMLHPVILK